MKILVVGISVRAMVASAIRSGYAVLALDAFGDRDLKSLAEAYALHRDFNFRYSPDALCEASRQFSYDAVAYTSNLENYPRILQRLAGSRKIVGNSPQSVAAVRHWAELFDRLERAGFPVPETIFAGRQTQSRFTPALAYQACVGRWRAWDMFSKELGNFPESGSCFRNIFPGKRALHLS